MFKVNNKDIRTWRHSGVYIVNFEQISHTFCFGVSIFNLEQVNAGWEQGPYKFI